MRAPRSCALVAGVLLGVCAGQAEGQQLLGYNFDQVTALANASINGQNVGTPVPGFDLLILKDGREVYHRAFGQWSLNRIAQADSSTKTISGAVIMSLVESNQGLPGPGAGRFTLDTTLGEYFTGLGAGLASVTIRQAFSHTSGIGPTSFAEQQVFNSAVSSSTLTLQQAAQQMLSVDLAYTPGSVFWYGGNSMHIAGALAERASGQSFNALYDARVRNPLGLITTRFTLSGPDNPRVAGGCQSNASEFGRFMEMLRRGGVHQPALGAPVRVLSQTSVDALFTRQSANPITLIGSPLPGVTDYGVGVWLDRRDAQGRLIGAIAAGARGFASWIDFDDGVVGVFATDTTQSSNVLPLYDLLRDAIEIAVRNPLPCVADFNQNGFAGVQDIYDFLDAFFSGAAAADVNSSGDVSVQDIFDYLDRWFEGC